MATVGQLSPVKPIDSGGLQLVTSGLADIHIKPLEKVRGKTTTGDLDKVTDVSRRKITSLEAQRILSVLDETIKRVGILTLLPYVVENLDRFSVILGDNLVRTLKEYDYLERAFTQSLRHIRKLSQQHFADEETASSTRPINDLQSSVESHYGAFNEHENLQQRLNHVLKVIVRLFSQNPRAFNLTKSERNERPWEANRFLETLTMLRELSFYRLVTSPKEEKDKEVQIVEMSARHERSVATGKKLTADLNVAVTDKDKEINKRNEIIRNLKSTIHNVEKTAEDLNRKIISEAAKSDAAELKNSDGKKAKLHQEVIQLKQTLQSQLSAHRESELALRKRKYKMEKEVENWIQKFDIDMGERQDEFDELNTIYTEEKKQLEVLEERFKVLEEEYVAIMEERRIAREKKEAAELELQRMIKAATVLQSLWRAYRLRKMLKNKAKKKKGKGKGKKGGRKR